jgi:hypothetical protein
MSRGEPAVPPLCRTVLRGHAQTDVLNDLCKASDRLVLMTALEFIIPLDIPPFALALACGDLFTNLTFGKFID